MNPWTIVITEGLEDEPLRWLQGQARVVECSSRDPAALQGAREAWKAAKAAGHDVTYWKESPTGKWEKQG